MKSSLDATTKLCEKLFFMNWLNFENFCSRILSDELTIRKTYPTLSFPIFGSKNDKLKLKNRKEKQSKLPLFTHVFLMTTFKVILDEKSALVSYANMMKYFTTVESSILDCF